MDAYTEFKKRANDGYQPDYTYYESTPTSIIAGNVPGFQSAPPRNRRGLTTVQAGNMNGGQQGWDVTRDQSGNVTAFSNQAGLERQQRMQQIGQTGQAGNLTPEQYRQLVAQRQYQMQMAAYQQRVRQAQLQQMAMQRQQMQQQQVQPVRRMGRNVSDSQYVSTDGNGFVTSVTAGNVRR